MGKIKKPWYQQRKAPPIDWLWAAILERKMVYGCDLKEMAVIGGTSYEMMRKYARKSPWDWPRFLRENICKEFGINLSFTPDGVKMDEGES